MDCVTHSLSYSLPALLGRSPLRPNGSLALWLPQPLAAPHRHLSLPLKLITTILIRTNPRWSMDHIPTARRRLSTLTRSRLPTLSTPLSRLPPSRRAVAWNPPSLKRNRATDLPRSSRCTRLNSLERARRWRRGGRRLLLGRHSDGTVHLTCRVSVAEDWDWRNTLSFPGSSTSLDLLRRLPLPLVRHLSTRLKSSSSKPLHSTLTHTFRTAHLPSPTRSTTPPPPPSSAQTAGKAPRSLSSTVTPVVLEALRFTRRRATPARRLRMLSETSGSARRGRQGWTMFRSMIRLRIGEPTAS